MSIKEQTKISKHIQSVERALDLLETLSEEPDGLSLMELSVRTGLHVSTCHHLLATLFNRGYVIQDPRTKFYMLGNRVLHLQTGRSHHIDLVKEARPILRDLNQDTRETVHLAVLEANDLVTLTKLEALHAVKVDNGFVGKSDAAHATATGKAILAFLSETQVVEIIHAKKMKAFTERTITDPRSLLEELKRVRELGYAIDNEEFQPGVYCVGAPVRNHVGKVVASISCSVPLMRLASARLIEPTRMAADRLSERLGYSGP